MGMFDLIDFSEEDIAYACASAFLGCVSYWGISFSEMAELVSKFRLATFVEKNVEYLNCYGIIDVVNNIRSYIIEQGGPSFHEIR